MNKYNKVISAQILNEVKLLNESDSRVDAVFNKLKSMIWKSGNTDAVSFVSKAHKSLKDIKTLTEYVDEANAVQVAKKVKKSSDELTRKTTPLSQKIFDISEWVYCVLMLFIVILINSIMLTVFHVLFSKLLKDKTYLNLNSTQWAGGACAAIVAPITEELSKFLAAKKGIEVKWTIVFNIFEFILYIGGGGVQNTNIQFSKADMIKARSIAVGFHSFLQTIHTISRKYGYPKTGLVIASILHGLWNFTAGVAVPIAMANQQR